MKGSLLGWDQSIQSFGDGQIHNHGLFDRYIPNPLAIASASMGSISLFGRLLGDAEWRRIVVDRSRFNEKFY